MFYTLRLHGLVNDKNGSRDSSTVRGKERQAASFVPLKKYYLGDLMKENEARGVSGVVGDRKEIHKKFCCGDPKEREYSDDQGAGGRPILKWNINNTIGRFALENCALLCHDAASSGSSLPTFRDNLSGPTFRVKNVAQDRDR